MRITGPLLLLRLYDSRATAVSPLSAFGWKGRLSVTSVLELGGDTALLLMILFFPSLLVSLYLAFMIWTLAYTPPLFRRPWGLRVWGFFSSHSPRENTRKRRVVEHRQYMSVYQRRTRRKETPNDATPTADEIRAGHMHESIS